MTNKILRLPAVIEMRGLSRSSIYLRVSRKEMPTPIRLGGENSRAVGWLSDEIESYVQSLVAASKSGASYA
jgi:prophage regulatory protein